MNETDMTFLIDQLVNSMEFYADETEFSQHFKNECDLPEEKGKQIFNAYWDLSPTERADWNTEQWEYWVTNQLKYAKMEFIASWSPRYYTKGEVETVDASFFTEKAGYKEPDIEEIYSLSVGEHYVVDSGHVVIRSK